MVLSGALQCKDVGLQSRCGKIRSLSRGKARNGGAGGMILTEEGFNTSNKGQFKL